MNLLRDPIWAFIGVIVATFISLIVYRLQQSKKALAYEIISNTPLLSVTDEIKGDVAILYKGKHVTNVYLIIVRLFNAGKVPILAADFDRPIKFDFGEEAEIIGAEVLDTIPHNLKTNISFDSNLVTFPPLLLNPGDTIKFKAFLSGYNSSLNVDARIVGVKDVIGLDQTNKTRRLRKSYVVATALLGYALFIALLLPAFKISSILNVAVVLAILIQGIWEIVVAKYGIIRISRHSNYIESFIGAVMSFAVLLLVMGFYYLIYGRIDWFR